MAIQISGTTVISDSKAITNVVSYSGDGVATQAEAEAGTNNDQLMTPLRVKQAIEAMGGTEPDIATEGWPGTDTKGVKGFGWSATCNSQSLLPNSTPMTNGGYQTGGNYGQAEVQDMLARRTNAWSNNRNVVDGSGPMGACGMQLISGTYNQQFQHYLVVPGSLEGKTLDIYWCMGGGASTNFEITVMSLISYSRINSGNARVQTPLNVTNTTMRGANGNRESVVRARLSNLPDTTGIKVIGSPNQSYNSTFATIGYYEIY